MDYDKIKQLMSDMENSNLSELNLEFPDGTKIGMKKAETKINTSSCTNNNSLNTSKNTVNEDAKPETNNNKIIKSPMVGTFYIKPSPTANPYVEVGSNISIGDTVCIIEAMKLMNEIEADVSGKIVKILAKDGEPVEYGMPLFEVE